MKIKTKVRAGRECGGPPVRVQFEGVIMKIKTKVRAGRECGGGPLPDIPIQN